MELKKVKKGIGAIMIVGLIIAVIAVEPISAYTLWVTGSKDKGVVHLKFTDDEKWDLFWNSDDYAKIVVNYAKDRGYKVKRSTGSIEGEIRAHALGYILGEREHSNPMDIELYSAPWWSYLLD
mgnify:CR=1 FL=1